MLKGWAGFAKSKKAAPGRETLLFRTPWKRLDDGWCIAARANARAMALAGIDVRLISWMPQDQMNDEAVMDEIDRSMLRPPQHWALQVLSCPLMSAKYMVPVLENAVKMTRGPQGFQAMFERQSLEPELVESLKGLTGIWAQCSANQKVLKVHGVESRFIRYPYFDDDPHLNLSPPKEHKRFLWIGRAEHRKAPDVLLYAFLRAFRPRDAELTMKLSKYTHNTPCRQPEHAILDALADPMVAENGWTPRNWFDSIRIVRERLSREEMVELHAKSDVYVSASRGEGLDLPSYAAKLAGRTLVTTDSGGPRDFLSGHDVLVPQRGVMLASEEYPWGEGATYSAYNVEELIEALQAVRGRQPSGERTAPEFRAEAVAKEFREWFEELRDR